MGHFSKLKKKRFIAALMAATLACTNAMSTVTYAVDGYSAFLYEDNPVYAVLRNFTFSNEANAIAESLGTVPTGLSLNLTMTYRNSIPEPYAYGKWWLGNERGQANTDALVPLASDPGQKISVDFSKMANHYNSCIEEHNASVPGTSIPNDGLAYVNVYGGQFFAYEAYVPTENPRDYPAYIRDSVSDVSAMKFYLLLMSILHSFDKATASTMKDDAALTEYSAIMYSFTRALEGGLFQSVPSDFSSDWDKVVAAERALFETEYNPSTTGNDLFSKAFEDGTTRDWFKQCWNDAMFMSQFDYSIGTNSSGEASIYVSIPWAEPALGSDGKYHKTWDYSSTAGNASVYGSNMRLALKSSSPSGLTITNKDSKIDISASTLEELADEKLGNLVLELKGSGGDRKAIQPAGLISGRNAIVDTNGTTIRPTGQLRFLSFSKDVEIRLTGSKPSGGGGGSSGGGGGGGSSEGSEVVRYEHTETFTADYNVRLRKYDSETGKALEGSHWDILEEFTDYNSQLSSTVLEDSENWANEGGSQFKKWDGWDWGPGNPSGDSVDPCLLDDDVTDSSGQLVHSGSGDIAHTDTKTYIYKKGYCGGHPEKPEPEFPEEGEGEEDIEGGGDGGEKEPENQEEIEQWEADVDTCSALLAEGGYFCATAENGYEAGQDADGSESRKQMEDDRDKYYLDFINLYYTYSAVEIQARPGYILHTIHTDDVPVESVVVRSSQSEDYDGNLSHQSTPSTSSISLFSNLRAGRLVNAGAAVEVMGDKQTATPSNAVVSGSTEDNRYLEFVSGLEEEGKAIIATYSNASDSDATPSDADHTEEVKESWLSGLYEDVRGMIDQFVAMIENAYAYVMSVFARGGVRAGGHPTRDSVSWTPDSEGNYVATLDRDNVAHTFNVYDHRTEGEIHINKRDMALNGKDNADFDSYTGENGDGSLEGAIYGLFATENINHPDGKTGVVYQKDDLVAVATTDRNGDASFMVFTEAPGKTYDYTTGRIVKRTDKPFSGPTNLTGNETLNGNCWIGRPLIAGASGSQYYIKELSRSEGYELSVTGKKNFITNGQGSWQTAPSSMEVSIAPASFDGKTQSVNTAISGSDIDRDVTLRVKTGEGASFASVYTDTEEYNATETIVTPVEVPVIGTEGTYVTLNGASIEATLGMGVSVNGVNYTVTKVSEPESQTYGVNPANKSIRSIVPGTTLGVATKDAFVTAYNQKLDALGYDVPAADAPWIRVELTDTNDTDWIGAVNTAMTDRGILFFNRARITEVISEGGKDFAVVRYDHATKGTVDNCVFNTTTKTLYVKYATGNGYFIYVPIPVTSDLVDSYVANDSGFVQVASLKKADVTCSTVYPAALPTSYTLAVAPAKTYWVYDGVMQQFNNDGTLMTTTDYVQTETSVVKTREVEVLQDLPAVYDAGYYTVTVPQTMFTSGNSVNLRILAKSGSSYLPSVEWSKTTVVWMPTDGGEDSYIKNVTLTYPDQRTVIEDASTGNAPATVNERPIRQKIRVNKAIETLETEKHVWYCLDCGLENGAAVANCAYCNKLRTDEAVKIIVYENDTYGAVHTDNLSVKRDGGMFSSIKDWLAGLLDGTQNNGGAEAGTDISGFRFKAYLKSNLERLYRTGDGTIIFLDRNGNSMSPQYEDTNGDGNYDTFTWKYDSAFGGKTVDFPEKDQIDTDDVLQSANVQKIYTEVDHQTSSKTTSDRANNVWDTYQNPQNGHTQNVGESTGYTTSMREDVASGKAVVSNAALYSYKGINADADYTPRINNAANTGYTRILETTIETLENGTSSTKVEQYNYEKFFDAIDVANTDKWDDDMLSSKENYPGQQWLETFREKYQKDDADANHTLANTDGADADGTAGGDRSTSFKPIRWIAEALFGNRADYEKYPAEANGSYIENKANTSEYARMNAKASDAVRQFAVKWYLEEEAAKLMKDNGNGENIAISGVLTYDEAVYDEALMNALAKTYDYLIPFYTYDLDTIYSVEWDSEAKGGADKDYTTLTANKDHGAEHYNLSAYLPYGTYVITELTPGWVDGTVNEYRNRSYMTEEVKEVTLPSLYDAAEANEYADNYDPHYEYAYGMDPQDQAKEDNYLIRFAEEWGDGNTQSEDEYVIMAHNFNGDFEVYKYGLDIDRLTGNGYAGWKLSQSIHDPLKDYYDTDHAAGDGTDSIGTELGGNSDNDYFGIDATNGKPTANGSTYDGKALMDRFFYGSVSEDAGIADQVIFTGGTSNDNNPNGIYLKNDVKTMTGELTSFDGLYSSALVPWTVTAPTDLDQYDSDNFIGYADVNERNTFYSARLRINKVDADTGEYILHDNAIFALYATSRYTSFDEIKEDANLITDAAEKAMFLDQFKPGDTKFYLQDTVIEGSKEFLEAMGAEKLQPMAKGAQSGVGVGMSYTGTVKKGTPVCVESERVIMTDYFGDRTGQMTAFTTLNDVYVEKENGSGMGYANQNTGYLVTPQPVGAGTYALLEIKAPDGYARSKPVCYEIYADHTSYYTEDMYSRVTAVRTEQNRMTDILYN